MTWVDGAIVIVYFAMIVGVGIYSSRQARTPDGYLVAGGRLGYLVTFTCLSAVLLGGASTIGTTALGYTYGISGIWLVAMLGLGLALVGVCLVKRIRRLGVLTVAELLAMRFGPKAGVLAALVSAVYTMMVCATQVIAMGTILQGLAGWDPVASMVVVGCVVVGYTILGGMWAITLTDFVQFAFIVVGIMFVMLPQGLDAAGGFDALVGALPSSYFDLTSIGLPTIVQYFFLYCLGALVGQDLWQRYLTAKSVKVARRSGIAAGGFVLIYAVACSLIGMAAAVYMPGAENAQLVFAAFAGEVLPTGALGLVLVAVLAVLMSTASGTLLASSSLLANDVVAPLLARRARRSARPAPRGEGTPESESGAVSMRTASLRTSRLTTAAVGAIAVLIAVCVNDVLAALDVSYAILSGALFCPVVLGIFWKRATVRGAFASILASTPVIVVGLALSGTSSVIPIACGLLVSASLMVGVSLLDGKRARPHGGEASD